MALITRSSRKMYMGIPSGASVSAYHRMKGFTSLSESKNPQEYTRKYVDEDFETTDVTGVTSSYSFTFDLLTPNEVLSDLASIIDDEKIGEEAEREFISVDFHKPVNGETEVYEAYKRVYSVVGDSIDGSESLQYSGNFKAKGELIKGHATVTGNTVTFNME